MNSQLAIPADSTSRSNSRLRVAPPWQDVQTLYRRYPLVKEEAQLVHIEGPVNEPTYDELPEYMTEKELDRFLAASGVIDKLLSRINTIPPSPNWKAELDEL